MRVGMGDRARTISMASMAHPGSRGSLKGDPVSIRARRRADSCAPVSIRARRCRFGILRGKAR